MKNIIAILSGLLILILSSCGPKIGSPEATLKLRQEEIKKVEDKVADTVDDIPDWCLNVPISDFALAACGAGESASMNIARSKAILDAKRQLADSLDSDISAKTDGYAKAIGTGTNEQVQSAFEEVIKNVSAEAKLIGYKQTKTKAFSRANKYQFFVLLEFPIGKANQALLNQIQKNEVLSTQKNADKAMADLEAEINKRKQN